MFEVYATSPESMDPGQVGAHAARAEAMGYDGLHVPDALHDGLLLANNAPLATRVNFPMPENPYHAAILARQGFTDSRARQAATSSPSSQ